MLLDTNALIWLATGEPIREPGRTAIEDGLAGTALLVSAVSAWELSTLVRLNRIQLNLPLRPWLAQALSHSRARLVDLSAEMALEAGLMPVWDHRDPGDRLLVATARILGVPMVTRDDRILRYAAAGHLRALAC